MKTLLKKGTLSGFEMAKIVMSQSYELLKLADPDIYDSGPASQKRYNETVLFTQEEIENLFNKNIAGRNEKLSDYRDWLNAFPSFLSNIHCAHINYLQIERILFHAEVLLRRYFSEAIDESGKVQAENASGDCPFRTTETILWKEYNQTPRIFFTGVMLAVKEKISVFLFRKSIAEVLTEVTGVNFPEKIDKWYEKIQQTLDHYQDTLKTISSINGRTRDTLSGALVDIDLDELKVGRELEDKFKDRLQRPLGGERILEQCYIDFCKEMARREENGGFMHTLSREDAAQEDIIIEELKNWADRCGAQ